MTDYSKDELLREIHSLTRENQALKLDNDFLQRQNAALKLRCSKYSLEISELTSEIQDLKFTKKYLNSEEAGAAFARSLLGHRMTDEEVAIDEAENNYVPYNGDDF